MNKIRKGFTLIELLVVMAIFSILLLATMALTGPVSRMFSKTSLEEKTYSYANNIQEYLQGALEYSDSLYVYTSDKIDGSDIVGYDSNLILGANNNGSVDPAEIAAIAEKYRKDHYDGVISYDGTKEVPVSGNIYVLRLVNSSSDPNHKQGQITKRVYSFADNIPIATSTVVSEEDMLNPAFFEASDSAYSFSYAIGADSLVVVPDPTGGNDVYKALKADFNNNRDSITSKNVGISIVLDKDKSHSGYKDVSVGAVGSTHTYRAFKTPVAVQVANLPLTNINFRSMAEGTTTSYGVKRYKKTNGKITLQTTKDCGAGFEAFVNANTDFENDIYFVFAYPDELV
jgi:prepilin-type N-terminal cleavage/methylation domain-containing protein